MSDIHAGRRASLRQRLRETDGPASLLVTNLINIRYLCGFTGSNAGLLISPDSTVLATDFRYLTQAEAESGDIERVIERACALALTARAVADSLGGIRFESDDVSVHALNGLQAATGGSLDLVPATGVVEALRVVKDAGELADLTQACAVSGAALEVLLGEIRVGLTERQVARRLDWLMLEHGADAVSFETIVASGANSAIPHHQPTEKSIAIGDLLKIDFGAMVRGYHADCTRTYVVGAEPTDWQREIHDLVRTSQRAGTAALRAGVVTGAVDKVSRDLIAEAGFGNQFGHGLGHGVGLEIHEAPSLAVGQTAILLPATPVTVEPGVYLPGRGGVRIEDTLVVWDDTCESLTTPTRELLVLG
ncbi:MAG: aminopeptidase P family protein [Actinomycetes bacterium]